MARRAQTLLLVLFLLVLAGVLVAGLARMWQAEISMRSLERDGLIAFYLAQAGIERAKVEVLGDVGLSGNSAWHNDLDIMGDNYNFRYNFNVAILGTQRTLIGTGEVLDTNNNLLAHREITVTIDGIDDTNSASPPQDTDYSGTVVAWSWREI